MVHEVVMWEKRLRKFLKDDFRKQHVHVHWGKYTEIKFDDSEGGGGGESCYNEVLE